MFLKMFKILIIIILFKDIYANKYEFCQDDILNNDNIGKGLLFNHNPIGFFNKTVTLLKTNNFSSLEDCVKDCCKLEKCDAIYLNDTICYIIHCKRSNYCKPVELTGAQSDQYYLWFRIPKTIINPNSNGKKESNKVMSKPFPQFSTRSTKKIHLVSKSNKVTKLPKNNKSKTYNQKQLFVDIGPDMNIKILKSSFIDKPEIISIQATVKILDGSPNHLIYSWKRHPGSPAVGSIVNNSDSKPTLILVNLLQGQYVFELTVTSFNGNEAKDSMILNVTEIEDEMVQNLLDIDLNTNVYQFSQKDKETFSKRLAHVIEKDLQLSQCIAEIHSIKPQHHNNTRVTFYAKKYDLTSKTFKLINSGVLERKMRNKILHHKFIFDYPVLTFRSRICYNDCGGHGTCDPVSYSCQCHLPWFNNIYHENKTGFSNCDMHVMLVVVSCIAALFMFFILLVLCKNIVRKIRANTKYGRKILQYKLLEDTDS